MRPFVSSGSSNSSPRKTTAGQGRWKRYTLRLRRLDEYLQWRLVIALADGVSEVIAYKKQEAGALYGRKSHGNKLRDG